MNSGMVPVSGGRIMIVSMTKKETVSFGHLDSKFWRKGREFGFIRTRGTFPNEVMDVIGGATFATRHDGALVIQKAEALKLEKPTVSMGTLIAQILRS
jgi:hypothetical protein